MFEDVVTADPTGPAGVAAGPRDGAVLRTADLRWLLGRLVRVDESVGDAERIDQIRLLEELKGAVAATQARVTVAFAASQRAAQVAAGVPADRVGRGVAAQVALARRESPARADRQVGWARILVRELPQTLAVLQAGRTTEWRAQLVARETAWLSTAEDRRQVDAEIAPRLEQWGDRRVEAETRRAAYRVDPHGYLAHIGRATKDRRVTLRPAPESMSVLSGVLPLAQGVAAYAALCKHAERAQAAGDERSRAQIMADTLVERVTGQAHADVVPVEVGLLMTDQALLGHGPGVDEPGHVDGYGPIPAALARELVRNATTAPPARPQPHEPWERGPSPAPPAHADQPARADTGSPRGEDPATPARAAAWLRRLYTNPASGELVAMDSRRREFDGGLARFLVARDQTCRTPGATPRCGTATTSSPPPAADRPAPATGRACARPATTPSRRRAGTPCPHPAGPAGTSPRPRPPGTPTAAHHRTRPEHPDPAGSSSPDPTRAATPRPRHRCLTTTRNPSSLPTGRCRGGRREGGGRHSVVAVFALRNAKGAGGWLPGNVPIPEAHLMGVTVALALHKARPLAIPGSRLVGYAVGSGATAAGVALSVASVSAAGRTRLEHPDALVTTGPFAHSRNPMYVSWLLLHLGVGVMARSGWTALTGPLATASIHAEVKHEEAALDAAFGAQYAAYRATVPRYLPRASGLRALRRSRRTAPA